METRKPEHQVWQRVLASPEAKGESLRPLLLPAMEAAGAYRALSNTLTGTSRDLAKKLYQLQSETVACLRGLEMLSGAQRAQIKALPQPRERGRYLAEKCYHRALHAMTEYTARSLDTAFGTVFQSLAHQEGENCKTIAQLLGTL